MKHNKLLLALAFLAAAFSIPNAASTPAVRFLTPPVIERFSDDAVEWRGSVSCPDPATISGVGIVFSFDYNLDGIALDGGVGMIWNAFSFLTLAGFTETSPRPWGTTLNNEFGADFGVNLKGAYALRFGIDQIYNLAEGMDWRFGAVLHLHALLSLYSGRSPRAQTIALSIRFGMGNWEGFSALRRHSVLGTTSIQGLHWRKETKPPNR